MGRQRRQESQDRVSIGEWQEISMVRLGSRIRTVNCDSQQLLNAPMAYGNGVVITVAAFGAIPSEHVFLVLVHLVLWGLEP